MIHMLDSILTELIFRVVTNGYKNNSYEGGGFKGYDYFHNWRKVMDIMVESNFLKNAGLKFSQ